MKLGKVKRLLTRKPAKVKAAKLLSALCPVGTVFVKQKVFNEQTGKLESIYVISGLEPRNYDVVMPYQNGEATELKTYSCPAFYSVDWIMAHLETNTGYFVKAK